MERFARVFSQLISQEIVDETTLMLDSTIMQVHQHWNVSKK